MDYQLKRINPFWHTHPIIPTLVAVGGILGFIGYARQTPSIAYVGGVIAAAAILGAARPALSLLFATMGLLGGLTQFAIAPTLNASTFTAFEKVLAVSFYTVCYAVLLDAVVLVGAALYNFYAGVIGFGGLRMEFENAGEETTP